MTVLLSVGPAERDKDLFLFELQVSFFTNFAIKPTIFRGGLEVFW